MRGRRRGKERCKDQRRGREGTSRTICPGWPHQGEDRGTRNKTRRNHREIRGHIHKDKASVETSQNLINLVKSEMTKMR